MEEIFLIAYLFTELNFHGNIKKKKFNALYALKTNLNEIMMCRNIV